MWKFWMVSNGLSVGGLNNWIYINAFYDFIEDNLFVTFWTSKYNIFSKYVYVYVHVLSNFWNAWMIDFLYILALVLGQNLRLVSGP